MTNLNDIKNAILEKQKGINADIETLIRIAKENRDQVESKEKEMKSKELEYNRAMSRLGVKIL